MPSLSESKPSVASARTLFIAFILRHRLGRQADYIGEFCSIQAARLPRFRQASANDMVALYTVWYNYVKQHKTLKGISPAMAAGLSETLWSMTDLAEMIDASLPKTAKRGPYRKRID